MSINNIRLRTHYIYLITNNLNGYNYVGKRSCRKYEKPENRTYMGSGYYLKLDQERLGMENFSKEVLAICYDINELNILEIQYIALYRSIGKAEYNIADGGEGGNLGEEWLEHLHKAISTEEYHQKLRDGQRRRWSSKKARKECGEKSRRSWQDPEIRKRHIEGSKGRVCSDECKKKIAEKNHLNYIRCRWYTNGKKDILSRECPEGFHLGRSNSHSKGSVHGRMSEEQKQLYREKYTGLVWWNNGIEQIQSRTQPKGFVRGKLPPKRKLHWYNNGEKNIMSESCPKGFREGKIYKKH